MDWFFSLEGPTQVAIIGVLAGLVAAVSGVAVAIVNSRKPAGSGGGSTKNAEIAALTIDSSSVMMVAAALEAINMTLIEWLKTGQAGSGEMVWVMGDLAEEVEELRRELRALTDKMRDRS